MSHDGSLLETTEVNKVPKYYLTALGAWVGAYSVGSIIGYSSPAIPSLKSESSHIHINDDIESWFGSLMPLGGFFGGLLAGKLIDLWGRRSTLMLVCVPLILGWLMIAYANNVAMLLIGRFVTGFCAGILTLSAPVYIAETSTPKARGFLGSGFQLSITCGVLTVYVVGTYLPWSYLAAVCAYFPLVQLLILCFMPETPTWLISKGQIREATEAVFFLYGSDHNLLALSLTRDNMDAEPGSNVIIDAFTKSKYRYPISICLAVMFFQQFSGINAIMFYTVSIFDAAKSSINSNLATIIVGIVQTVVTLLSCFLMDKMGRRLLLLASGVSMAIAMLVMSTYYFLLDSRGTAFNDEFGWIPLAAIIVFIVAFSLGYGPIPWLLMSELIPIRVKGFASGLTTAFNWLCIFVLTKEFTSLADIIHFQFVYLILALVSVAGFVFVFFFVPETKGKSLVEIESFFFKRDEHLDHHHEQEA